MTFYKDGWDFSHSAENESRLRPLCEQVEQHFQLPSRRLYRYFARTEHPVLLQMLGEHYRGFYCHIPDGKWLPSYFFHSFYWPDYIGESLEDALAFDDLIFVRHTTCNDTVGCVTTYAHELQHFVQHGRTPRLLRANNALYENWKKFDPTVTASDVPSEREANIVSKQVAETVCGADAVETFAQKQVQCMEKLGNTEQLGRWVFFRDVRSSTPYDMASNTMLLVERYRSVIDFSEFGVNVDQPNWWAELPEACHGLAQP